MELLKLLVLIRKGAKITEDQRYALEQEVRSVIGEVSQRVFLEMVLENLGEERLSEDLIENLESLDNEELIMWLKLYHPKLKKLKKYDSRRKNRKSKD